MLRHYFPGQLELNAADSPTRSQPRSRAGDLCVSIFLCSMFVIPRPSADARPRARDPNSVVSDEGVYACPLSVGTPIIRHTMHYRSTVEACAATYHRMNSRIPPTCALAPHCIDSSPTRRPVGAKQSMPGMSIVEDCRSEAHAHTLVRASS